MNGVNRNENHERFWAGLQTQGVSVFSLFPARPPPSLPPRTRAARPMRRQRGLDLDQDRRGEGSVTYNSDAVGHGRVGPSWGASATPAARCRHHHHHRRRLDPTGGRPLLLLPLFSSEFPTRAGGLFSSRALVGFEFVSLRCLISIFLARGTNKAVFRLLWAVLDVQQRIVHERERARRPVRAGLLVVLY
jgi:hypothetical protein